MVANLGRIEPPVNFPVEWADPADAQLPWRWERWHAPDALKPLAFDVIGVQMSGMRRGARAVGRPTGIDGRLINNYYYFTLRPLTDEDPHPFELPSQADLTGIDDPWTELWLPRVQSYLARWEAFDRESADASALLHHLDEALIWFEHCWEMHARLGTRLDWEPWCERNLGWRAEDAREWAAGLPNKSLEGDAALRALADMIRTSPEMTRVFSMPAADVLGALESIPAVEFGAAFDAYLDSFGRRSDNFIDVSLPTWREDPLPVVSLLKMYALQPQEDFVAEQESLRHRRAELLERARAELAAGHPELVDEFETELAAGRWRSKILEDHNYWIDQQSYHRMRLDLMAAGRVLHADGALESRDDILFLTLDEVRAALRGSAPPSREIIERRREAFERWRTVTPPAELGAPFPAQVAALADLLFGGTAPGSDESQLKGQPASKGVVIGRARLIRSLAEADRLGPGDILVTKTTTPPWTPLFGVAGAIVTDAGGALSHAAVVAREYGIPAVVGTTNATTRIKDGQLIRVDGSAGTVDLVIGE